MKAIIGTAEKIHNRSQNYWISNLWTAEDNSKVIKALVDHAICAASRKKLDWELIKKMVDVWLDSLNIDPNDSILDIEVEKYVAIDEHSRLSYIIAHRLSKKVLTLHIKPQYHTLKFLQLLSFLLNTVKSGIESRLE